MMVSDGIVKRGIVMGTIQPVGKTKSTTPRAERPRNPRPIFGCVLGETAKMIVPYAEVQSPTVTPLPEKPQVFLMTLNEIGRLGPKRSKVDKKIRLGKLRRDPATQDEKYKKYSITVRKCPDSALGHLEKILVLMLDSQGASHRDLKLTVTDLAVEVSFGAHAKFHLVDDCVKKAMELCRNLFANLHAFSLAEFLADFASDLHYARAVLSRRPWNFPSDPDWGGV